MEVMALLWTADRVRDYSCRLQEATIPGYNAWKSSRGMCNPEVDPASVDADYLKVG